MRGIISCWFESELPVRSIRWWHVVKLGGIVSHRFDGGWPVGSLQWWQVVTLGGIVSRTIGLTADDLWAAFDDNTWSWEVLPHVGLTVEDLWEACEDDLWGEIGDIFSGWLYSGWPREVASGWTNCQKPPMMTHGDVGRHCSQYARQWMNCDKSLMMTRWKIASNHCFISNVGLTVDNLWVALDDDVHVVKLSSIILRRSDSGRPARIPR